MPISPGAMALSSFGGDQSCSPLSSCVPFEEAVQETASGEHCSLTARGFCLLSLLLCDLLSLFPHLKPIVYASTAVFPCFMSSDVT